MRRVTPTCSSPIGRSSGSPWGYFRLDTVLTLLRDLIAIDSVNPSLVPGAAGEAAVAARVAGALRTAGLDVEVAEVAPGRSNVVGVLEGRAPGRSLMLCGHLDTVGVEGMAAPFDPIERDGCLYGRGAQDMKGGVAAMVDAVSSLAARGMLPTGRVIVAAVADEEFASVGAEALVRERTADGAVVTEPTDLTLATGHKGFEWVEGETRGRAAHGSRPVEGLDAILRMGRVLTRLEAIGTHLRTRPMHPLLGTASLHASTISGGRELSGSPDYCQLRCERRTMTGEPEQVGLNEVRGVLEELCDADPEFEAAARPVFSRPPYEVPVDDAVCLTLAEVMRAHGLDTGPTGMTYWTDAAILGNAGIPTVLFGPGGAGLHGPEEYVDIDSVRVCRDVLKALVMEYC